MAYERSSYHRKWWVRTIRERNYFGHRYWWFNWALLLCCIIAFVFSYNYLQRDTDATCLNRNNLSRRIDGVNEALDNCCSCNKSIPPPKPPQQEEPPVRDSLPPPPPLSPRPPLPPPPLPENAINCNSFVQSGGEGVKNDTVILGTQSGMINITYDMESVPDKLEVFYEGNLISSTFEKSGNDDGYVGGDLGSQLETGTLNFLYRYHIDQFVTVRVTGRSGTSWKYTIDCPK